MKIIKLRDGSAIYVNGEINIDMILGSNKRFIKLGDMIINRADITAIVSKQQFDDMEKLKNGMVLTSQGWLSGREYKNNSFLKIVVPESLTVYLKDDKKLELDDGKTKKLEGNNLSEKENE